MTDITELYAPQFEQFGVELREHGCYRFGRADNERGSGSAWIMPLSPTCLVMEHYITPRDDMMLAEYTPERYACVSEISTPTLECMPAAGITPANLRPARGPWPQAAVCSFIQETVGVELSPLHAGKLYHSRSILFLPGYFDELERAYPGQFTGLFESFAEPWSEEASLAISTALRRVHVDRIDGAGAHLYMKSISETMVAELARITQAGAEAVAAAGTLAATRLAEEAVATIEHTLDAGRAVRLDALASQLYVSRSKLCATFKQETGEAVGAYVRRRRCERACELLSGTALTLSEIAGRLGYASPAAFTQAFKQQMGETPSAWRARQR